MDSKLFTLHTIETFWNKIKNKFYVKSADGIPKSDLDTTVQSSLSKADSALQEHQDISGKQDKSTAVTHEVNTGVGSATKPVYIAENGVATAISHSINADVPANAKFTDTTYNDVTQSTHGLMTAEDKKKLDDLAHAESISSLVFKNDSSKTYMGVKFSANRVSARFLIMENNSRRADIYVSIRIGIDTKATVYASWNTDTEFRIFYDNEDCIYVIFNCSAWSRGSCISTIENAIMTQWNGTSYPSNLTAIATDIRYMLDSVNFTRYAADKNHTHQYVPWIAMGGSGTKALYGIFASLPDTNPSLNQGATLLITDAGDFISGQTGAWLVQISNRNDKPWMIITTLIPHAAGDVQFGYYHDTENKLFYFGVYTTPYRSTLVVSTLRKDNAVIKNFVNYTSAPSGWTVVNPMYDITKAATLTDSGWIIPTFPSGIKNSTIRYRKQGKIVSVSGYVTFSEATSAKVVLTLPEGYRPPAKIQQFNAADGSAQASF